MKIIGLFVLFGFWAFLSIDWYVCKILEKCQASLNPNNNVVLKDSGVNHFHEVNKIYFENNVATPLFPKELYKAYPKLKASSMYEDQGQSIKSNNKSLNIIIHELSTDDKDLVITRFKNILSNYKSEPWYYSAVLKRVKSNNYISKKNINGKIYYEFVEFEWAENKDSVSISNHAIRFTTGSSDIDRSPALSRYLEDLANSYKNGKMSKIEVLGHTDNIGSQNHNIKLSQSRALKIKELLVKKGVLASSIKTMGYGPNQPVSSNSTVSGRSLNRRVEIKFK